MTMTIQNAHSSRSCGSSQSRLRPSSIAQPSSGAVAADAMATSCTSAQPSMSSFGRT